MSEQTFASIIRNRSGQYSGELDFVCRTPVIEDLHEKEKISITKTAYELYSCISATTGFSVPPPMPKMGWQDQEFADYLVINGGCFGRAIQKENGSYYADLYFPNGKTLAKNCTRQEARTIVETKAREWWAGLWEAKP